MNKTDNAPRMDPLVDAYRQASDREGALPGANLRAAVLAHALVVAQSTTADASSGATLRRAHDMPAANDPSPVWRLAAGIVLGLALVWMYQLTRPGATGEETAVATASAPAARPAAETAQPVPGVAPAQQANGPAASPPPAPAASAAPMPTSMAGAGVARGRVAEAPINVAAADSSENAAHPGTATALAKVAPLPVRREAFPASPQIVMAPPPQAAPVATATAASANADVSARSEMAVALAETPKLALRAAAQLPAAPAAVAPAAGASVATDVPASPSAVATTGSIAGNLRADDRSAPIRQGRAEMAMFVALRTGDIAALRAAIASGANVNARDERGQSALQVAHERKDAELIRALEVAGARQTP